MKFVDDDDDDEDLKTIASVSVMSVDESEYITILAHGIHDSLAFNLSWV